MQDFENNTPTQQPAPQSPQYAPAPGPVEGNGPVYTPAAAPGYQQPAYTPEPAPVYQQPAYTPEPAPVYQQPAYTPEPAPVYQEPAYTPEPAPAPQEPAYTPEPAPAPQEPAKPKKDNKVLRRVIAAILVVLLIGCSAGAAAYVVHNDFRSQLDELEADYQAQLEKLEAKLSAGNKGSGSVINSVTSPTSPAGTSAGNGEYMSPAQVYAANLNSVVLINNVISSGFYSSGGTGSGFILTEDGYVVTNYHVIEGGGKLSVVTADGTEYPAELIGADNANDVALLKIEAEGMQAVTLGDSDALIVGDQVAAIGNPLGELTSTLTVGYVSAKERDVNTSGFAINMIQTDAAINSGNSGGPLFNMYGHVVGITTAKYSGSSSSGATIEGIGFAIPINDVQSLLEDLVEHGYVTGPYLGVSVSDMDSESAAYFGMPMGAYVKEVEMGYCAQKAGMKAKDIIVKVGQYDVDSVNSLSKAMRNFEAGDTVEITVVRSGAEVVLTVTFDEKPRDDTTSQQAAETEPEENNGFGFPFPNFG